MAIDYSQFAKVGGIPKPEPRKRTKRRKDRARADHVREVRQYVFARERDTCRICRFRRADSMHELRFRSLGGTVSKRNSVAVCGSGTTGCHGFAQRHEIEWSGRASRDAGAEGTLWFQAMTTAAAEWLRIQRLQSVVSPVMQEMEDAV